MTSKCYKWIAVLLFTCAVSLLTAKPAQAEVRCVADLGGLIDGFVTPNPPAQIQIDGNCTIRNFPASNPLTTNFSFFTSPGTNDARWLVIFDNVVHTGQMSCDKVQGHKIWFVNSSTSTIKPSCQNSFIPVEKINKLSPGPTASIGVAFTYKLIIPVMFDPVSGTVSNTTGSPNDLHDITVTDDLNAMGVDVTFVSEKAYWLGSGASIPHTFSNSGGALTFGGFPIVPAGRQMVIEVTVVLNDTVNNAPGKQFINTSKWMFGRLIDGIFYEPLPGEWGISSPMTIAAPALTVTKSGPTTMNMGQWGNFGINIQNTGTSDAWNPSVRDVLPRIATGGMCDLTPEILSAQVFAADGTTAVPGKGPLTSGSDYSVTYSPAPSCQLDMTMLSAASAIGPTQRLIIRYRTKLDSNTQNGVTLTNVAGAIQWFNGDSSNTNRKSFNRTLTDGTPGVLDFQDAHNVTTALTGYFFDKTVADVTSNVNPATTAKPGDKLRYTLRFRTTSSALSNFSIVDEMDALNTQPAFAAGTLTIVAVPAGADVSATSSTGGTKGTGVIDIRNLSLPVNSQAVIQFDITLKGTLTNGTIVSNQATALNSGTVVALSDDPNVNGTADPTVTGDEDPTRVTIVTTPPVFRVQKSSADITGDPNVLLPGDKLHYTITVQNVGVGADGVNVMLRDVIPANTTYVAGSTTLNGAAVADVAGTSPLVSGMLINSPANATAGLMPAGLPTNTANIATITFDVTVNQNVAGGTAISNQGFVTATGVTDVPSDDPRTPTPNDPTINIVGSLGPPILIVNKSGPVTMNLGQWGDFGIDIQNTGATPAWNTTIRDLLPRVTTGGMCDLTPEILSAQVFAADGATPVQGKGALISGSDYSFSYSAAPSCALEMTMLTAAATIGPSERLIIRYRTKLDANTQNGITLTNIAGAIQWFNGDSSNTNRKTSTGVLTNGTPGVADNQDAHDVTTALSGYIFEKTVADLTSGVSPATTAAPGDKLRYTLRFRTTNQALTNFSIVDEMDGLNSQPYFAPGTLTLVTVPSGADTSATSNTGGAKGTGVIDIRNLSVPLNGQVVIEFDITLKTPLANGTIVTNQATLRASDGTTFAISDDPNVNGVADPKVVGDEDPTRVTIASPPAFRVQKISADLTGDPNVLLPGDKLRYTITVKNTSNADALNVMLRDAIPANTTYVAGSTTLNGAVLADVAGASPLMNGMLINSPANATAGLMPTGPSTSTANVATITFDVTVNQNVAAGTVISNQGFVTATGTPDQPSDDPRTPAPNDPTINIVGGLGGPTLIVSKSGPTTMNIGQWGDFTIDVQNTGGTAAWNTTIRDLLPHGTTGGMCDLTPEILSAQVFAVDGVTPAQSALNSGSDYSFSYTAAPNCQLDLAMQTAAGTIGPNQHLIIRYRTKLDDKTQNGITLTNIVGAIQWFNGDSSNPNRKTSTGLLTNGTPGVADNQDAHNVTTALSGYIFEKTVVDLTSGVSPATTAVPGDKLRYTLRFRTTNQALTNFSIVDEMDGLNSQAYFAPGTLALVTVPSGADTSATSNTGGAKGTGVINIRNLSVPLNGEVVIDFDITLKTPLANGTIVSNQATLRASDGTTFAMSDDPNVNGVADPKVSGDEDPTRVTIASAPAFRVQKISADLTGDPNVLLPGDKLRYTITVKNTSNADALNVMLRDAIPANTTYVAGSTTLNGAVLADVAGASPLVNGMLINSPANATAGLMPSGPSSSTANVATITFDVTVNQNVAAGTVISNQGFVTITGTPDQPSDDPRTPAPNDPTINIVGGLGAPALVVSKSGPTTMNLGQWGNFTIDVQNTGATAAWNATIRDLLPHGTTGGMCDLTPEILSAQVFAADGATPAQNALNSGSDYLLSYSAAPNCQLDMTMQTAAGTIGPNQHLIIRYRTKLDAKTQNGITLTNIAGAIQWFNADSSNTSRKTTTGILTNGTPGVADNQDAHTVTVALSGYFFEKTVANLRSGVDPATTAVPGDKLRYTLRFRTTNQAFANFSIVDEMDALNAQPDFVPGSLILVTTPAGADVSATSGTGGTKGTGIVDVRNLIVSLTDQVVIQYDITLKSSLANDTIVANQAKLLLENGTTLAMSDDPNVNGAADPNLTGDEDPTKVKIVSSSVFRVQKISTDLTGDPNVLLPGDKLRYTITAKNISNAEAVNVTLRDAVPANTTYVAGSTTLNGAAVADVAGVSPLVNGMLINSPANPTAGLMPSDPSSGTASIATITFDVIVNPSAPGGTVISNQGIVSAKGITDQPSDDPRTPALNDPTIDIVANRASLFADKRVVLFGDKSSPGIVDPGDVLRYTITIKNSATVPATGVSIIDAVPANTTYVAGSTTLNGAAVADVAGGSPLASGISIGTIAAGATATLQYDLRVNDGTPAGTVISNQAAVSSTGLPNVLTDGDGNPATGPEPTVVVVGAGQEVSISNTVSVVGGGAALPGSQLEYVVKVTNVGAVPAYNVVMTDNLAAPLPNQLGYVNSSATMNGSATGINFAGSTITGNYGAANGALAPGDTVEYRFRATLNPNLALGTVVTNTSVATWNNPVQTLSASASITVGSVPVGTTTLAVLSGSVWHDANFDDVHDSNERALAGWTVELYRDSQLSQSAQTDANGGYSFSNVEPNNGTGVRYELRFHAPGAGPNTAMLGRAASPFTNAMQRISDIIVSSGADLQGLNLPIHPNGVIYNSSTRAAIAGATLTLSDARSSSPLPAACFDDAAQQGQITLADGYYKFDINFSDPACPSGGDYLIGVTAPAGANYVAGYSLLIPPKSNASTAAFSVPACPASAADAIPGTALYCEVQSSEFAPVASIAARSVGTTYYVHLILDGSGIPGTSQIFNNHIALDPQFAGTISISKTTPLLNVTRGQLVPYVITATNRTSTPVTDVSIVDHLPVGFNYVAGSALIDGVPTEPSIVGRDLRWNGLFIEGNKVRTVKLLVTVGAGVNEGEFVNRAQAMNGAGSFAMSGEATATVRLVPDVTMDCTDVTGKVFNDANRNGWQDDGENGLPGVRVVTAQGLQATTDQYGRYHITCAITPNENRGSNFVLKLDDRTLPTGFRLSTDQVQTQRATRGKALKMNFGASIHRSVAIDLSDEAFEPGKTEIRVQWKPRLDLLMQELRKAPAVLRLSYVADTEDEALVKRRMDTIKRQLTERWSATNDSSVLTIEPEVFWRRGAPAKQPDVRLPKGR